MNSSAILPYPPDTSTSTDAFPEATDRAITGVFDAPYPVMLDLSGRRALVVGGGPVGTHKAQGLLDARAIVTVVSPTATADVQGEPRIDWHQRSYLGGEAANYSLVITATDDPAVNAQVAADAHAANVWVNSADDPQNCSFILPSVMRRGDLCVSISTNGQSPALARWARQRAEATFGAEHQRALDLLAVVRSEARDEFGTSEIPGWSDVLTAEFFKHLTNGDDAAAVAHARRTLGLTNPSTATAPPCATDHVSTTDQAPLLEAAS